MIRSQKAPSAKRCIKTHVLNTWHMFSVSSQKAPSAKRCIKTLEGDGCLDAPSSVRKHRAPKGALRQTHEALADADEVSVRKHRAPQISHVIPFFQLCTNSQKSRNFNDPTSNVETTGRELRATFLRNHPRPAPNGALRQINEPRLSAHVAGQKAPSTKRCIKTKLKTLDTVDRRNESESTERQMVH